MAIIKTDEHLEKCNKDELQEQLKFAKIYSSQVGIGWTHGYSTDKQARYIKSKIKFIKSLLKGK